MFNKSSNCLYKVLHILLIVTHYCLMVIQY